MEKTFHIPKIKRVELMNKLMIDPSDIRKGLPTTTLPQLTDQGMILSLTPQKAPLAKLTPDGTLKLTLKYNAQVVQLLGKYIEVKVIDNYDDFWIGNFFGLNVRGKGGKGQIRGCKVTQIEGQNLMVEYVAQGGNQLWGKMYKKIQEALAKSQ